MYALPARPPLAAVPRPPPGHFQPYHVASTFPPPQLAQVIEAQWLEGFKRQFFSHESPVETVTCDTQEPPLRYVCM